MSLYKWLVGLVLTVLMVVVVAASAILFSARDFQYGLRDIAPSGLVQIDRLLAIQGQIDTLEARAEEPRGQQLALVEQLTRVDADLAGLDAAISQARGQALNALTSIEASAGVTNTAIEVDAGSLAARARGLLGQAGVTPADQQALGELQTSLEQLAENEQQRDLRYSERVTLASEAETLARRVDEERSGVLALQASIVSDPSGYERVRSEVMALQNLSPWGVSAFMAQGHPSLLSTVLVLLMGALGALLYLFPAYLNRPQPVTMAEIAVRLIFGMCAALAFYVLANATIAGFSIGDGVSQANSAATLNPFTVSLIGIVAGVMAEDLAKWIQDRGRGIFTQGAYAPTTDAAAYAAPASNPAPDEGLVNPHGGPNAP